MTKEEQIKALSTVDQPQEMSFPMLFVEGLLYSILSFGIVIGAFYIIQHSFPPKVLLETGLVVTMKWFTVILVSSSVFALSKIGDGELAVRVFLRTLAVGIICSVIIFSCFWTFFRFVVSLDDIFAAVVKISNWRTGSLHFKKIVRVFAIIFLFGYPVLFMAVKYTLHKIFWSNEDELLAPEHIK